MRRGASSAVHGACPRLASRGAGVLAGSTLGPMPLTEVQSQQVRILQSHGHLTTARISHILDYRADALRSVADNWQSSPTPEGNTEVRQVASEALALLISSRQLDPGV